MLNGFGRGRYGVVLCMTVGLGSAVGCGGATESPPPPSTTSAPRSVEEFTERLASSYCQSIAACCSRQGFANTDCVTTFQAQLLPALQQSASNPKSHLNGEAAARCIDAYVAANSACTDHALFEKVEEPCEALFEGTTAIGAACGDSAECAPSDAGVADCSAGVCVLAHRPVDLSSGPRRKLGETCAGTCEGTAQNSNCDFPTSADPALGACWTEDGVHCDNGICATAASVGDTCTWFSDCDGMSHCVDGVCVADQSDGPCTRDNHCLGANRCDYTLERCVPLVANGEPCEASEQCLGGQCYEFQCRTWTVAGANSCLGVLD